MRALREALVADSRDLPVERVEGESAVEHLIHCMMM